MKTRLRHTKRRQVGPLRAILSQRLDDASGEILETLSCGHIQPGRVYSGTLEKRVTSRQCGQCEDTPLNRYQRSWARRRALIPSAPPGDHRPEHEAVFDRDRGLV